MGEERGRGGAKGGVILDMDSDLHRCMSEHTHVHIYIYTLPTNRKNKRKKRKRVSLVYFNVD